ncbi:MAG TPA: hypothetical protein VMF91_07600 [Bryobacteraceae bacterium]|nr:hypothetical protein [Bryobacteraceae bacterium]
MTTTSASFHFGQKSMQGNPEELVESAEHRPTPSPFQHRELLAKHQILYDQTPMTAKEASERSEAERKKVEHGAELYQTA